MNIAISVIQAAMGDLIPTSEVVVDQKNMGVEI